MRLPLRLWQWLLRVAAGQPLFRVGAMDGTYFSLTNPSYHYLHRIDGKMPRVPVQATVLVDARSKRVMSLRVRVRPRRDFVDTEYLLRHAYRFPCVLVADADYDVERVYAFAKHHGLTAMVPRRKGTVKGINRKYMQRQFNERVYHQRSNVEAVFSAIKRRSGSHVLARSARSQRAELHARYTTHNLKLTKKTRDFQQSRQASGHVNLKLTTISTDIGMKSAKTLTVFKPSNVLRYPRLDTVLMVEEAIQKAEDYPTKAALYRSLPKKMMYQTFNLILDYLEHAGKIHMAETGGIIWLWNPKLVDYYMKHPELHWDTIKRKINT